MKNLKKILFLICLTLATLCLSSCQFSTSYITSSITDEITILVIELIVAIISLILQEIVSLNLAIKQEKNAVLWFFLTLILGWLAPVILSFTLRSEGESYTPSSLVHRPTPKSYICPKCKKVVAQRKCTFCGYENPKYQEKPKPFSFSTGMATKWECKCGSINSYHDYDCPRCFSPRPKQ